MTPQNRCYDVFLSHHSGDKPLVEVLARRLVAKGIKPFLDAWHLVPGGLWQNDLANALAASRTCAVIVGAAGLGPWAELEMFVAQDRQARDPGFRLIPVLLPGARKPELPAFLTQRTWVELPDLADEDAFRRLLAGIRGEAPVPELGVVDGRRAADDSEPGEGALPPNPFGDQGRITDSARFFDREEILGQIFAELAAGRNVSLVGEAQVGKSSVLTQVCVRGPQWLGRPAGDFVYLDMQDLSCDEDFFEAFSEELGSPGMKGWKLKRALKKRRIVLCLDEIEKMTYPHFTREVRAQLRGLADGNEAPLTLLVAVRTPLAELFPDSSGETSPLAPICPELRLGPFLPAVAREFLRQRLATVGRPFAETEEAWLVDESGGHPGRLQALAYASYLRLLRVGAV